MIVHDYLTLIQIHSQGRPWLCPSFLCLWRDTQSFIHSGGRHSGTFAQPNLPLYPAISIRPTTMCLDIHTSNEPLLRLVFPIYFHMRRRHNDADTQDQTSRTESLACQFCGTRIQTFTSQRCLREFPSVFQAGCSPIASAPIKRPANHSDDRRTGKTCSRVQNHCVEPPVCHGETRIQMRLAEMRSCRLVM